METTTNYNLKKPAQSDYYNIDDQNANMDTIDTELKKAETHRSDTVVHITAAERTAWNAKETTAGAQAKADAAKAAAIAAIPSPIASAVSFSPISGLSATNVQSAIESTFTGAVDVKNKVASAINGKGSSANTGMTGQQLADAITAIVQNPLPTGNAETADVLAGKTFSSNGAYGKVGTLIKGKILTYYSKAVSNGQHEFTLNGTLVFACVKDAVNPAPRDLFGSFFTLDGVNYQTHEGFFDNISIFTLSGNILTVIPYSSNAIIYYLVAE